MWAADRPSIWACGPGKGRSERVGEATWRAEPGRDRADPGGEAVLGAAAGVANAVDTALASIEDAC